MADPSRSFSNALAKWWESLKPWHVSLVFVFFIALLLLRPPLDPKVRDILFIVTGGVGAHLIERILSSRGIKREIINEVKDATRDLAVVVSADQALTAELKEATEAHRKAINLAADRITAHIQGVGTANVQAIEAITGRINDLVKTANQCGIGAIYEDRAKAAPDVYSAIENATHTVLVLGISLSQIIQLDSPQFQRLSVKAQEGKVKLKVLLLDPLRSPALFRTFLENDPLDLKAVLKFERNIDNPLEDPLYSLSLYKHVESDLRTLNMETYSSVQAKDKLRFYGHYPTCWLVLADNSAFFQPYTFGRPSHEGIGTSLGPFFPVIKFVKGSRPFEILEDHFEKIWCTSDGFFHYRRHWNDRGRLVKEMFSKRGIWLERVLEALDRMNKGKQENRKAPRQRCESKDAPEVRVAYSLNGITEEGIAEIYECSEEGVRIRWKAGNQPGKSQQVKFQRCTPSLGTKFADSLLEHFLGHNLQVVWSGETQKGARKDEIGLSRIS